MSFFLLRGVVVAISACGGTLDIAVGYDPVAKAKVERLGATIQNKVVGGLPGHLSHMESRSGPDLLGTRTHRLLPFDQVVEIVRRAVYEYNYVDRHSHLKCTPYEAYKELSGTLEPIPTRCSRR